MGQQVQCCTGLVGRLGASQASSGRRQGVPCSPSSFTPAADGFRRRRRRRHRQQQVPPRQRALAAGEARKGWSAPTIFLRSGDLGERRRGEERRDHSLRDARPLTSEGEHGPDVGQVLANGISLVQCQCRRSPTERLGRCLAATPPVLAQNNMRVFTQRLVGSRRRRIREEELREGERARRRR
jgi:hypothetical protein